MTINSLNSGRPFRVFDVVSTIMPVKYPFLNLQVELRFLLGSPSVLPHPLLPCLRSMVAQNPLRPILLL